MPIVICPGVHPPELTQSFLQGLGRSTAEDWVFPADRYPAYSKLHILAFVLRRLSALNSPEGRTRSLGQMQQQISETPLLWVGFSAGVVGAIGAAHLWQLLGGRVMALIALDGWGVPLWGDFPIYRVSHDAFTDWSSALLGGTADRFYAEPPISHLDLWRSPQLVRGHWVQLMQDKQPDHSDFVNRVVVPRTAADFINTRLSQYPDCTNT
ncbi:MAG TPA: hypothetical protein V6D10_07930 [Trichocoleus sp.]